LCDNIATKQVTGSTLALVCHSSHEWLFYVQTAQYQPTPGAGIFVLLLNGIGEPFGQALALYILSHGFTSLIAGFKHQTSNKGKSNIKHLAMISGHWR
jgi:hypothetical protein